MWRQRDMNDLGYEASLKAHYRQVFARLGHYPTPARVKRLSDPNAEDSALIKRREAAHAECWPEAVPEPAPEPEPTPEPEDPNIARLPPMPIWKVIIRQVCKKHGITVPEIIGPRRSRKLVEARHEAFWRLSKETMLSLPRIGYRMGGKDHTTVLHGIRQHERRLAEAELSTQFTQSQGTA